MLKKEIKTFSTLFVPLSTGIIFCQSSEKPSSLFGSTEIIQYVQLVHDFSCFTAHTVAANLQAALKPWVEE